MTKHVLSRSCGASLRRHDEMFYNGGMAPPSVTLDTFPVRAEVKGDTTGYVPLYHALHAALRLPREFRPNETGGWIGDDMKAVRGKKLAGALRVLSTKKVTYRGVNTHYIEVSYAAFDTRGTPVLWSQDNDPDRPMPAVLIVFHSPKGALALTAEHLAAANALRGPAVATTATKPPANRSPAKRPSAKQTKQIKQTKQSKQTKQTKQAHK